MRRFEIDLYSDTKSRPTSGMLEAMMRAEVGDEQHEEDPTVAALTQRVATQLGQDAAIFLPSGTMANEIAVLVHCRPGDEIIAHESSHLLNYEGGAPAALAGAMVRPITGPRGLFDADAVEAAIRPDRRHLPRSRLLSVEQTANVGGGTTWPLDQMRSAVEAARKHGLAAHIDGARLFNASVASGIAAREYAELFDTVYLDFTKGLGAPFGAVLAGRRELIDSAWRWKQRLGGSMRQAGFMAAACDYALDHNVARLAEDHANARTLEGGLASINGIEVEPGETNMVFFDVRGTGLPAVQFNERLEQFGLRVSVQGATRLRAVTHIDITSEAIARALAAIKTVANEVGVCGQIARD